MNWDRTIVKYVFLKFSVSIFHVNSAKTEKIANLFIDYFFKYCKWFCHCSLLFIIILKYLLFFSKLTKWFDNLKNNSKFTEMFFLKWINWYFVETNIDSCVFAHFIVFSCDFRSAFKVFVFVLFIVMIVTSFTKSDVAVLKLLSVHISNSSAL